MGNFHRLASFPKPKLNMKKTDHFLGVNRWNYLFFLPAAWQKNCCRIVL